VTRESPDWQSRHAGTDKNAGNASDLNGFEKHYGHDEATINFSPFHLARLICLTGQASFSEILPIQVFFLVHLLINHNKISCSAFDLTAPVIIIF